MMALLVITLAFAVVGFCFYFTLYKVLRGRP